MRIRYRNTLIQLVALQKFMLRNSAFGRKMMLHRFIMVECILMFICIMFAVNHNKLVVLTCFAGLSGLAWLFRERTVILQFKKDFRREKRKDEIDSFDRDRIMTIDTDGFRVLIGSQENRYNWNEVEAVGRDKGNIYILLNGVLHYVVPKSAWEDPAQSEQFFNTLQNYRDHKGPEI
jgi:hypothetical protein